MSNYKNACEDHLKNTDKIEEINVLEHFKVEREMNAECRALTYMMGLDKELNACRMIKHKKVGMKAWEFVNEERERNFL